MIHLFQAIFIFLSSVNCQTKLNLHGPLPLHMDCQNIAETDNGFIGLQYFYDQLSQQGKNLNLDKITFSFWIMVNSKMKLDGRQIIFAFVDGYSQNPYMNLMLYYQLEYGDYYMYLVNSRFVPEILKLKIDQVNDLYIGFWNHILLSIDQSNQNAFLNLKFFSTYNYQLSQKLETLVSQKLIYRFGFHSRITNEQLYDMVSDYKACVDIANFDFINGWTTMDSEVYVDYDVELKFFLKPFQIKNLNVDSQFQDIKLRVSQNQASYSGTIGLLLYRDKQIVYTFEEQMSSFTIMFWVKQNNINKSFQFLSFTDDMIQETIIGFGVNKQSKLVFYQYYTEQNQLGTLTSSNWNHITIGLLDLSINEDFIPQNLKKIMRTFIGATQSSLIMVQNIKTYKRLVIGPVFKDSRGSDFLDIQDIRIFKGYGILQSQDDCQLFVGPYCAFCKSGTHYCKEQDPNDDNQIYNCPAGYKEESNTCVQIAIANCLRQQDNYCQICAINYQLDNITGRCNFMNTSPKSPFNCQDSWAIFCQKTILQTMTVTQKQEISKLCKQNVYTYHSSSFTCSAQIINQCNQAQYLSQCYKCNSNYALTESKTCRSQQKMRFQIYFYLQLHKLQFLYLLLLQSQQLLLRW
ncbi:unnamed protein product [Paramecium sonneborni]|uniref:Bowman-birk serine protease inhibitor family protein n=1 Tax=Paramecium sonneborni TaxID=65129 RepID=A0A8S1K939_9CILI|nr:unnamed protein product [Paramecium sonneborni]